MQQYHTTEVPRAARGSAHGWTVLGFAAALTLTAPAGGERVQVEVHAQLPAPTARGPERTQNGRVSWYGPGFHGRRTANGEVFDTNELTMAHRTLPFGTEVRVINLTNGRSVVLRVNDRGPYVRGRIADLSHAAAARLGFVDDGVTRARIEVI
jgi:rare lipoprotein A (peptidoglycan hydrolase)